jgi:hypothetical protein
MNDPPDLFSYHEYVSSSYFVILSDELSRLLFIHIASRRLRFIIILVILLYSCSLKKKNSLI